MGMSTKTFKKIAARHFAPVEPPKLEEATTTLMTRLAMGLPREKVKIPFFNVYQYKLIVKSDTQDYHDLIEWAQHNLAGHFWRIDKFYTGEGVMADAIYVEDAEAAAKVRLFLDVAEVHFSKRSKNKVFDRPGHISKQNYERILQGLDPIPEWDRKEAARKAWDTIRQKQDTVPGYREAQALRVCLCAPGEAGAIQPVEVRSGKGVAPAR
jgi:hypothetical protein